MKIQNDPTPVPERAQLPQKLQQTPQYLARSGNFKENPPIFGGDLLPAFGDGSVLVGLGQAKNSSPARRPF